MRKTSIKEKIINIVAMSALICATICMPVMAKTYKWSMTLNYGVCDGHENGVHYKADKGDDINVTGTVTFVSKDNTLVKESYDTYCIVYRKQWFGSEKIATQKLDTFKSIGDKSYIDISAEASKDSSKYYLYFYKVADDGYNLEGSGKIVID